MSGVLRATAIAVRHTTQCVPGLLRVPLKSSTPTCVLLFSVHIFYVQSPAAMCGDKVQYFSVGLRLPLLKLCYWLLVHCATSGINKGFYISF